jgi:hypothetical protein
MTHQETILDEVACERLRQDARWGEQNHPSVPSGPDSRIHEITGILRENTAKRRYSSAEESGLITWAHIAGEEISEAVYAPSDSLRRGELVQLAAVIVAWIECIDRNGRTK